MAFSRFSAWACALTGLLTLVGWRFDIEAFKRILPGLPAMKITTAFGLLLCGLSLRLSEPGKTRRRILLARACALAAALIGLLTLADYWSSVSLYLELIDRLEDAVGAAHPGRMSPVTACVFILVGTHLFTLDSLGDLRLLQGMTLSAFLLSASALVGYTYGIPICYRIASGNAPMALHTAAASAVLALGILAARPNRGLAALLFLGLTQADTPVISVGEPRARQRVAFLAHPGSYGCRAGYYFPHLKALGAEPVLVALPSGPERTRILEDLPPCETVVIQRLRLAPSELAILRNKARRLVYDVDDPLMYRSSRHWWRYSLARSRGFRRMVEGCDFFLGSTPWLVERARPHLSDPRNAAMIPSTVDSEIYRPPELPPRRQDGTVVLGWLGSPGSLSYLLRLRGVLPEVCRRCPQARLRIVSQAFPEIAGVPIERRTWSKAGEIGDLQGFDVGLLPLSHDRWTRGRGNAKLFQYMAVGIPVVAEAVGFPAAVLEHGRTGFLAGNRRQWVEALEALCRDPGLRLRMGDAARRAFVERYSLQAVLPAFWKGLTGRDA